MGFLYDQFLLFGDSITEFAESQDSGFAFAPALRHRYIRRLDVLNRGVSGYNTDLALRVLAKVMPKPEEANVRIMTVWFGANDACARTPEWDQHVPLPKFKENLIKIVKHPSVDDHQPRIMLITPPPIDERRQWLVDLSKGFYRRRSAEVTKQYAEAVCAVGADLKIPVVDMWTACAAVAGWRPGMPLPGKADGPSVPAFDELFIDGLHLSPEGYRLLFDEVISTITANWPDQLAQNLPFRLPAWNEFPKENGRMGM